MADQTGRSQFGVALHEDETDTEALGDGAKQRALAGTGRTFEQHVAVGVEGGDDQFDFTTPTDDRGVERVEQGATGRHFTMTPRMFVPSRIAWYPSLIFSSG